MRISLVFRVLQSNPTMTALYLGEIFNILSSRISFAP